MSIIILLFININNRELGLIIFLSLGVILILLFKNKEINLLEIGILEENI